MSGAIPSDIPGLNSLNLEKHMFFICPECGQRMDNQLDWRQHLNNIHGYLSKNPEDFNYKVVDGKYYECLVCHKWLTNALHVPTLLQYHRFNHLPYPKTYRCRHCPGSYSRKRVLCEHLLRSHSRIVKQYNTQFSKECTSKGMELVGMVPNTYNDARMNKEFYIRFLCPLCGKLFARFQLWQQHIDGAHTSTSVDLKMNRIACSRDYYCTECSYALKDGPSRDQLRRHHFTHLPYPSYFQCSICHLRKSFKTDLFLHYIKHHEADYIKNKEYVRLPEEWGSAANQITLREIKRLMEDQATASEPQSDLLQKALQESFINLEEEFKADNTTLLRHEQALDQSLNGYENVFVIQVPPSGSSGGNLPYMTYSEIGEEDLEHICNEMFEEIIDCSPTENYEEQMPNACKKLKADKLLQEMQKYIHYLCPECGREFDNQATWRSHVFEQHNLANAVDLKFRPLNALKTSFLCLVCNQVQRTSKPADLRRHHFQHMPYQSYLKCTICTKTKSSKPKMLQHLQHLHIEYIQSVATRTKAAAGPKRLRCLECDKTYIFPLRLKNHCRACPKRLAPIAVGQYDISKNMKLLQHLQKASLRIDQMLEEAGINADSIKLSYK